MIDTTSPNGRAAIEQTYPLGSTNPTQWKVVAVNLNNAPRGTVTAYAICG